MSSYSDVAEAEKHHERHVCFSVCVCFYFNLFFKNFTNSMTFHVIQ